MTFGTFASDRHGGHGKGIWAGFCWFALAFQGVGLTTGCQRLWSRGGVSAESVVPQEFVVDVQVQLRRGDGGLLPAAGSRVQVVGTSASAEVDATGRVVLTLRRHPVAPGTPPSLVRLWVSHPSTDPLFVSQMITLPPSPLGADSALREHRTVTVVLPVWTPALEPPAGDDSEAKKLPFMGEAQAQQGGSEGLPEAVVLRPPWAEEDLPGPVPVVPKPLVADAVRSGIPLISAPQLQIPRPVSPPPVVAASSAPQVPREAAGQGAVLSALPSWVVNVRYQGAPLGGAHVWSARKSGGFWREWGRTDSQGRLQAPPWDVLAADTLFVRHDCCAEKVVTLSKNASSLPVNIDLEADKPRLVRTLFRHYGVLRAFEGAVLMRQGADKESALAEKPLRIDVGGPLGVLKDEAQAAFLSSRYFVENPAQLVGQVATEWGKDVFVIPRERPLPQVGIYEKEPSDSFGFSGRFVRQLVVDLLRNPALRLRQAAEVRDLLARAGKAVPAGVAATGWLQTPLYGEVDFLIEIIKSDKEITVSLRAANGAELWRESHPMGGNPPAEVVARRDAALIARAVPGPVDAVAQEGAEGRERAP